MYTLLIILILIAAILMCLIVLIQESKGGGLASSFSNSNQILGVRKTTDVIEKMTWGLAAFIVVLSICAVYFVPKASDNQSVVLKPAMEQKASNAGNLPGFGAAQQQGQQPAANSNASGAAQPASSNAAAPAAETPAQ